MLAACDVAEANTYSYCVGGRGMGMGHSIQRRGGEAQRKLQCINLISKIASGNQSRIFISGFFDRTAIEDLCICKP